MSEINKSQTELFLGEESQKASDDFHWRQFAKLGEMMGEMMGDGLHHEADGKWIVREYNQLASILIPDYKKRQVEMRKRKSKNVDARMLEFLAKNPCECGGRLVQGRSGSKVRYCSTCNLRYMVGKEINSYK